LSDRDANLPPMPAQSEGLIIRAQSGFLVVRTDEGDYTCRLRGRLKKERKDQPEGDIIAVGDRVLISPLADNTGAIETVLPRHSLFSRKLSGVKYGYQQILLANPDQMVFVFACAKPDPHLRMLDRFLVVAESQKIPALIVANKVDLVDMTAARAKFDIYEELGYELIFTSARTLTGVAELRERLIGKLSAFSGPSGVGKSSLLNAVQPGLGLEVRSVSQTSEKGLHTTQVRALFPLSAGGYVADMPGLRTMALWDIESEELDGYFPEMRSLVAQCQFNDCTHSHEPGCAVIAAVNAGKVDAGRYQSYLRLRFEGGIVDDPDSDLDAD
jgi:ribosome biogenesis GTPase